MVLASHETRRHTRQIPQRMLQAAATGRSPGSNRKLFSAEIAERRNWTWVRGGAGWGSRTARRLAEPRGEALATASGFRVALCRATSFPTRATYVSPFVNQGAPSDCLPISRRRSFSQFLVHLQVSRGDYPAAGSTRPPFYVAFIRNPRRAIAIRRSGRVPPSSLPLIISLIG